MNIVARFLFPLGLVVGVAACASTRPDSRGAPAPPRPEVSRVPPARPSPAPEPTTAPPDATASKFESYDFIVVVARGGETAVGLATEHLRDPARAWMVEEYAGSRTFKPGQEIVIPKRSRNPVGVYPWGYQLVPVLVYHNIGPETKGRLHISAQRFAEHMRYLHAEGFRAISVQDLLEFAGGRRQLPRKAFLLAFDDGYRSFIQFARPLLKELGFTSTLFVYTDFISAGPTALSWQDLRGLMEDGFDVQAHSKTHGDLRRQAGESDADYARRMEIELVRPLALFRQQLGRGSATLAYPYGSTDDELLRHVTQAGYVAAFTVRRQANPAFVFPFRMSRSQVFSEMTVQDLARNLNVFNDEDLSSPSDPVGSAQTDEPERPPAPTPPLRRAAPPPEQLTASHNARSEALERRGYLRQALDERLIALTVNPRDRAAQQARIRLEREIQRRITDLFEGSRVSLARGLHGAARKSLLAVLALDPTNETAFTMLQTQVQEVIAIVHTVRAGETLASLADLYYGDRARAEVIGDTNRLPLNTRLVAGQKLRIPEIPGIPLLPP